MKGLRCAAYLRVSTDKQSQLAPEDQLRKCIEFAQAHDWEIAQRHIYRDEAVSGAGSDRPGLNRLLEAALAPQREFEVVLTDDTSRLSRSLSDALRIIEQLKFAGLRFVAVSQQIDTEHEQSDVLVTVHGLVDSLYLKELAQKTHRGLEGRVLRGLHAGGRCFGYSTVPVEGGKKLEVNEAEAALVHRIFEMSASGGSLKTIAKRLNAEGVPPPRPRAGKRYATWCPSMIQSMLRRDLYRGRLIWNRSRFLKAPGTNRRLRRVRPQSEWRVVERPELRIITQELWHRVQSRLAWVNQRWGRGQGQGLQNRAGSSPYLLTGFLKCDTCGASLAIVTGRSGRYSRYGCPQNFYRGSCPNKLKERQDWLEKRLLAELQDAVLQPEAVSYAIEEFGRQLKAALANLSGELAGMRKRKEELEAKIRRIARKITEGHDSPPMMAELAGLESELAGITDRLLSEGPGSVEAHLADIRCFVTERLQNLPELLAGDVPQARAELAKHVDAIRMVPRRQAGGACYYRAVGQWDLLGGYGGRERNREFPEVRVRMVAGAGFEPATFGL